MRDFTYPWYSAVNVTVLQRGRRRLREGAGRRARSASVGHGLRRSSSRARGRPPGLGIGVRTSALFAVTACVGLAISAAAHAQNRRSSTGGYTSAPPSAVLLATAGGAGSAGALDSVLSARLEEARLVHLAARPGMDLNAVLLALDCVSETAQCLRQVTSQNGVDIVISPSLERTTGELVLTLMKFDARDGQIRRVLRRQTGATLSSETLDTVPAMLRELFGLPPEQAGKAPVNGKTPSPGTQPAQPLLTPEQPIEDGTVPTEAPSGAGAMDPLAEPPHMHETGTRVPVGPIVLASGGVLALGVATAFGISAMAANTEYKDKVSGSVLIQSDVDAAQSSKDTRDTNAMVANVLFGVGGAALVGAGIWLAVELTSKPEHRVAQDPARDSHVSVTPWVGPQQLGLVLTQRGVGL